MGKAGRALRQVLEAHSISQSKLAAALGVERPIVFRWYHEQTDPTAQTVVGIVNVLRQINPVAAENFINLYLGDSSPSYNSITSQELPESDEVDVSTLARSFGDTTNSYKFFFFIALLDILSRRQFDVLSPISFKELVIEMIANAWYPHTYFKLSFGSQDKITEKLDSLNLDINEAKFRFTDTEKKALRKAIKEQDIEDTVKFISRYVPFRLIRPFFTELARLPDPKVNQAVIDCATNQFDSRKPLYQFDSNSLESCSAIIVHDAWASYIESNYSIIRGWVSWEYLNYMQRRNPNVPALVNKLFMPQERESLNKQTKYWKLVLEHTSLSCIYSKQTIDSKRFSLDHYVPWSYVAHDDLWNLIPVSPEINSAKSNNLPAKKYLKKFVAVQYLGLTISHENFSKKIWNEYTAPFVAELKISDVELLNLERLENAYESLMDPLILLAGKLNHTPNWSYR